MGQRVERGVGARRESSGVLGRAGLPARVGVVPAAPARLAVGGWERVASDGAGQLWLGACAAAPHAVLAAAVGRWAVPAAGAPFVAARWGLPLPLGTWWAEIGPARERACASGSSPVALCRDSGTPLWARERWTEELTFGPRRFAVAARAALPLPAIGVGAGGMRLPGWAFHPRMPGPAVVRGAVAALRPRFGWSR